ncbi:hypothetical protein BdWA1_002815 [Babesia duncani]|uniref:Uncharacterized protein n=1 Tax=Babesia duncani TaxID=323732 RepID=A0AAD9PK69_9APIC|nr:hypothetical protein BdWA1_002815 [Babesia duncani]
MCKMSITAFNRMTTRIICQSSPKTLETCDEKYHSCEWTVERYPNVLHVVVKSHDANFTIMCYKQSRLIITNEETNDKVELMKLYISLKPDISLIINVLEPEWISHLLQQSEGRWAPSQTSKGVLDADPVSKSVMSYFRNRTRH